VAKIRTKKEKSLKFYQEHKKEYASLVKKANQRWRNIEERELSSPAVEEAIASRKGKHYFSINDFQGKDAMKELAALRTFLADETSTVKGAKYYTDTVVRAEVFQSNHGKPWELNEFGIKVNNYKEYFTDLYGEDFTSRVYSNYRKVEEAYGKLLLGKILGNEFDSETLITLMFDRAEESKKKHFKDNESGPEFKYAMRLMERYDEKIKNQQSIFNNTTTQKAAILYAKGSDYFSEYADYMAGQLSF
jgi:hypothetical protein